MSYRFRILTTSTAIVVGLPLFGDSHSHASAKRHAAPAACEQATMHARTARLDSLITITGAGTLDRPGGRTQYVWTGTDCIAWITTRGRVDVAADDRTISVQGDAEFVAHDARDTIVRDYVVASGAPVFRINGRDETPGVDDKQWIADIVLEFVRRTGVSASSRAAAIGAKAGPQGLLAEARHLAYGRVRVTYLLAGYPLVPDSASRASYVTEGAALLKADHDRVEFLAAAPPSWHRDRAVMTAAYDAASTMDANDAVDAILRSYPPPRPVPPDLKPRVQALIALFRSVDQRRALAAYYFDVRP